MATFLKCEIISQKGLWYAIAVRDQDQLGHVNVQRECLYFKPPDNDSDLPKIGVRVKVLEESFNPVGYDYAEVRIYSNNADLTLNSIRVCQDDLFKVPPTKDIPYLRCEYKTGGINDEVVVSVPMNWGSLDYVANTHNLAALPNNQIGIRVEDLGLDDGGGVKVRVIGKGDKPLGPEIRVQSTDLHWIAPGSPPIRVEDLLLPKATYVRCNIVSWYTSDPEMQTCIVSVRGSRRFSVPKENLICAGDKYATLGFLEEECQDNNTCRVQVLDENQEQLCFQVPKDYIVENDPEGWQHVWPPDEFTPTTESLLPDPDRLLKQIKAMYTPVAQVFGGVPLPNKMKLDNLGEFSDYLPGAATLTRKALKALLEARGTSSYNIARMCLLYLGLHWVMDGRDDKYFHNLLREQETE